MNIEQLIALLTNKRAELNRDPERNQRELAKIDRALKKLATDDGRRQQQELFAQFERQKLKHHIDDWHDIGDDYYRNQDNVEERSYYITREGEIEQAHIENKEYRTDIVNVLDERMNDGTLFFQRSLDGTSWNIYQKRKITSRIQVVSYGELEVDMGMTGPVRIDDEAERNRLLAECHVDEQALEPHKTGLNYVWKSKLDAYLRKFQDIDRMLHLMNHLDGQYILDHKDEAPCLVSYVRDYHPDHIDSLQEGLAGYDAEALETLLICSNMTPEAVSYLVEHQDPNASIKELFPMTGVQEKIAIDFTFGTNLNQDIYYTRNNREANRVQAILEGRKALIKVLNISDNNRRTEELGKMIRRALEMHALHTRGVNITSENICAVPRIMEKILSLLDRDEALRNAVGLTNEERNYYEAAVRVKKYHQEYLRMLTEANQNGQVQHTPDFVGKLLTYQLLIQMDLQNRKDQISAYPHSKTKTKAPESGQISVLDTMMKEHEYYLPLPLIQVARHEGGLEKLAAEMQTYVQKLPVYKEYLNASEKDFANKVNLGNDGTVMEEFLENIDGLRHDSVNGISDWYIDTVLGWKRTSKELQRTDNKSNTMMDKVKEQHRQSSKDPSRLESPKDIMQQLRKNVDAAWRLAHGASLKWKLTGDYKQMHSKLKDIKGYLEDHKGNKPVDVHKLETMMRELAELTQDYVAYKQDVDSHEEIRKLPPTGLSANGKKRYDAALEVLAVAQDGITKLNKVARYTDLFSSFTGEKAENFDAEKMAQVASSFYVNGKNYMLSKGWTELDELKLAEMCEDMQSYMKFSNDFVLLRNKPNDPLSVFTPVITKGMRPEEIAERKKRADEYNRIREQNLKDVREAIGKNKGLDRQGITDLLNADQTVHGDNFWSDERNKYYNNLDGKREIKGLIHAILLERGFRMADIEDPSVRTDEKKRLVEELRQVADPTSDLSEAERERKWSGLLREASEGIKKIKTPPIDINDIGLPNAYKPTQNLLQDINDVIQIIQGNRNKSDCCRQMGAENSFMNSTDIKKIEVRETLLWRTSLPYTNNGLIDFPMQAPNMMAVQNYIDKKGLKWNEELTGILDASINGNDYHAMYDRIKDVDLQLRNGDPLFKKYYQKYKQATDSESKNKWNDKILYYVDKVDKKQKIRKALVQLEETGMELNPILQDHLDEAKLAYNDLCTLLEPDQSGNVRLIDETIRRNGGSGNKSEKAVTKALKSIEEHCTALHAYVNIRIADMDPANEQTMEQLTSLRQVRDQMGELGIKPSRYTTLLEAVDMVRTPPTDSLYDRERLRRVCDSLNKQVPGLLEDKKVRNGLSENEQLDLLSLFAFKELLELQGGQMTDPKFQEKIFNQSWEILKATKEYDNSEHIYGTFSTKLDKIVDENTALNIAQFAEMRNRLKNPNVRKSLRFNNLNNQAWKDIVTAVRQTSVQRIEEEKRAMEPPVAAAGNQKNLEVQNQIRKGQQGNMIS